MRLVVFALALVIAAGCATGGRYFNWQQVQQLRPGMTERQVISIMGSPYSTAVRDDEDIFTWVWVVVGPVGVDTSRSVALKFRDGRLEAVPRIPGQVSDPVADEARAVDAPR